jgi:hypothetical protein
MDLDEWEARYHESFANFMSKQLTGSVPPTPEDRYVRKFDSTLLPDYQCPGIYMTYNQDDDLVRCGITGDLYATLRKLEFWDTEKTMEYREYMGSWGPDSRWKYWLGMAKKDLKKVYKN